MKSLTGFSNLSNHAFALFYHVWQPAHLDRKSIYLLPGDPKKYSCFIKHKCTRKDEFSNKKVLNYQWANLSLDILVKILSCHLSEIWMFKVRQVFWKLSKMRRKWLINVSEEPGMINTTPDNGRSLDNLLLRSFLETSVQSSVLRTNWSEHFILITNCIISTRTD